MSDYDFHIPFDLGQRPNKFKCGVGKCQGMAYWSELTMVIEIANTEIKIRTNLFKCRACQSLYIHEKLAAEIRDVTTVFAVTGHVTYQLPTVRDKLLEI